MATLHKGVALSEKIKAETLEDQLSKEWTEAWNALAPIRATWDEKEQSLLAQANDSVSGKITYAKITDAALSTLAFERQARVAAQLPTGKVIARDKADEASAKLANVALTRYIIPQADSQHPFLIKQRLWGVYASVYGSMPMFYDYRVDDRYIGSDCWLVDPRSFAIQPGQSSVQDADYAFISTKVTTGFIKGILKRETTTWRQDVLKDILKEAKDGKATKTDDPNKTSKVEARYDTSQIKGEVEFVTKYESGDDGHWITFAPDHDNKIVRDIPNPHKSGRIPIVMRHCFPLLNSIIGLGDYERGMKIQKAKDSLTNLFLEGAKNRIFPPLKINSSMVTMSTIKNQANARWLVSDMNGVEPVNYGNQAMGEFQAAWGSLQSMLMNQFGTTDTSMNKEDTGNPSFGKTPQAIAMTQQRQNARDTWDLFMHEQASQELLEGMINLLTVKMEKPINFSVFEEDMRLIKDEFDGKGLNLFASQREGSMTATKKQLSSTKGYRFLIDAGSSMSQNAQEQFAALLETWNITQQNPQLVQTLVQSGYEYDQGEHLKSMFIASGVNDWDKILKQMSPEQQAKANDVLKQQEAAKQQEAQQMQQLAAGAQSALGVPQGMGQPQPEIGLPPELMAQMQGQPMQQPAPPEAPMQFEDPEIAAMAEQLMGSGL